MLPPPCFSLNARTSFSVQVDIVTLYSLCLPNTQCLHTMREGLVSRLAIVTHKRRVRNYSMNCIHTTPHHKRSCDPAWRTRRNSHSACSPPACAVYSTDLRAFASFLQTWLLSKTSKNEDASQHDISPAVPCLSTNKSNPFTSSFPPFPR